MRRLLYSSWIFPTILIGLLLGILIYFLRMNFFVGQLRYFDMDELAHISMARHIKLGLVPFRDFFIGAPPGFIWFLTPLFFFATGAKALLIARGLAFGVVLLLMGVTSLLYFIMRRSWTVVFVPFFIALLPIPADKLLEVRPDSLSLALALLGTTLQVYFMERIEKRKPVRYVPLFIGLMYGLSLCIFPKTVPHVVLASIVFGLFLLFRFRAHKEMLSTSFRSILFFCLGGGIVAIGFFIWAFIAVRDMDLVWYSVTKMPIEVSQLGTMFPISPDFYFRPNDVYYGTFGYHLGFIMNAVLWGVGLIVAFVRFVTLFFQKKLSIKCADGLLISSLFLQLYLYISVYPLKHSQYLIPIAAFVCFYAADAIGLFWYLMKRTFILRIGFTLAMCLLIALCYQGFRMVTVPKLSFSNDRTLEELQTFSRIVPKDVYVLDLVGLTMDYPSPYYVMNLPFGQFAHFLSRPLPDLIENLQTHDVFVIYAGGRLITLLPEDQAYINDQYISFRNGNIFIRKDMLARYDFSSL